jgi:hypothetical protein
MKNETTLHIPVKFQIDPNGKSVNMIKDLLNDAAEKVCKDAFGFKGEEFGIHYREICAYDKDGKYEHNFGFRKQLQEEVKKWSPWDGQTHIEVVDLVPVIIKHDCDGGSIFDNAEIEESILEKAFRDELKDWVYSFYDSYVQMNEHVSATLYREEG